MHLRITILVAVAIIILGPLTPRVNADSWALPKKEKYYSPNKKYYLEVTPKKLESQLKYFEDKVDTKENAGAVKGIPDNRVKGAFKSLRGQSDRAAIAAQFPIRHFEPEIIEPVNLLLWRLHS